MVPICNFFEKKGEDTQPIPAIFSIREFLSWNYPYRLKRETASAEDQLRFLTIVISKSLIAINCNFLKFNYLNKLPFIVTNLAIDEKTAEAILSRNSSAI